MRWIPAKTVISSCRGGSGWFGADYNMNIYRGCCHGCIYCDSRSECYHVENFDQVCAKENADRLIESELRAKRKQGMIITGAMSDPYNPMEKKYQLTRKALQSMERYGFGVVINTKSGLVLRDIDLLQKIRAKAPVLVNLTITTADDALCRKIEPKVIPSSARFAALRALSQAGIMTGVLLMPVLPFLNDSEENILALVRQAKAAGASSVYVGEAYGFGVTLRQNQRDYFYQQLDCLFPGMKQKYWEAFGTRYFCMPDNAEPLWHAFCMECRKLGIHWRMKDIVEAVKRGYTYEQMSLF